MKLSVKVVLIHIIILGIGDTNSEISPSPSVIRYHQCLTPRKVHGCEKTGYKKDVFYYLFTRRNPNDPEFLHDCGRKFPEDTYFNPNLPTIIEIHAYLDGICRAGFWRDMKNEFLKRCDCNVIFVDWNFYSAGDYINAVNGLVPASADIAEMINYMKARGVDHSQIHIIGLSLGAHLCGLVGQRTQVGRITGIDPAGQPFYDKPNDQKLDRKDADFVDVIHTSDGRCLPEYGYLYPLGDEDFYVEDGVHQLNCYDTSIEEILKGDVTIGIASLLVPVVCFHSQSIFYFKASINPQGCYLVGKRCKNYRHAMERSMCNKTCGEDGSECSVMGMDWRTTYPKKLKEQRVYKVQVKFSCPFCIEEESKLIADEVTKMKKNCKGCDC